jgi:L-asparaginase
VLHYVPALKRTYRSEVNLSKIPSSVLVASAKGKSLTLVETKIRDASGDLFEDAIPSVSIVKDGGYFAEEYFDDPSVTADLVALVEQKLRANRLGGFVAEGLTPYGTMTSRSGKTCSKEQFMPVCRLCASAAAAPKASPTRMTISSPAPI